MSLEGNENAEEGQNSKGTEQQEKVTSDRIHAEDPFLHDSVFSNLGDPLSLVFRDLSYTVKITEKVKEEEPAPANQSKFKKTLKKTFHGSKKNTIEKEILKDLTGIIRPARLTAIMGASGAGKTSLLSVLAGQVASDSVEGQILINGEDYSGVGKMQKVSGFVFQDDVLLPTMKVREAIEMSALLRLPKSVSAEERQRRVDEIIKLLHLKRCANTKVGNPLKKGISGGERKRTSI